MKNFIIIFKNNQQIERAFTDLESAKAYASRLEQKTHIEWVDVYEKY